MYEERRKVVPQPIFEYTGDGARLDRGIKLIGYNMKLRYRELKARLRGEMVTCGH